MPETFDVYQKWLGITDPERPLNYYQLLRLKKFEDDTSRIRSNYRKLNAHVRKFATGQYGELSQKVLNELAKAMLCLTDSKRKAEYDATLGRTEKAQAGRSIEQILLAQKVINLDQLNRAKRYASAVGVDIREALVQQKLASADVATQAFAESVGVAYLELEDIGVDENLIPKVPALIARQNSCVPVMFDDGQLLLASPYLLAPEVEDDLRLRTGMTIRTVLCTAAAANAVINKYYPKEAADAELAKSKAAAAPKATAQERSPEEIAQRKKERIMIAVICGAFTVMGMMLYRQFTNTVTLSTFPTALGLGAVMAAIGFLLAGLRK
jgi:hypothetical protein